MHKCQYAVNGRQCGEDAEPDVKYCKRHNRGQVRYELKNYMLDKVEWRTRLSELSASDSIKTLTEEISLARMVLESLMNYVKDEADLVGQIPKITQLLSTIERLQKSGFTLERSLSHLISKPALMRLAGEIAGILLEELAGIPNYEDTVDKIIDRIMDSMSNITNKEEEIDE